MSGAGPNVGLPEAADLPGLPLDEDDVALAALAGPPFQSWDRLHRLLEGRLPAAAWWAVRGGRAGPGPARAAARVSLADVAARHAAKGVAIRRLGTSAYPLVLAEDHEAPPVLFTWGSIDVLEADRPRVAMIGTRRCTNYGRDVARQLGRELAEAGVSVVSGLAAGIDGAAHDGALAGGGAPPVGVVGSGLDVVYPRRHAVLWERVAGAGLLLSEAPLGCRPEPWRFPARNRIIAALAHVLVVVESDVRGGSMHTVRAAEERGVPVLAVPGPIRSRASSGTNQLLSQGCHPVCDTADVLTALSLAGAYQVPASSGPSPGPAVPGCPADPPSASEWPSASDPPAAADRPSATDPPSASASGGARLRPCPPEEFAPVLDALDWTPASLDALLARLDVPPLRVSAALAWLEREGWAHNQGGWWERR
ncbi:MAG TPA: DNA-processing protein DprA [Acidimicrobiales bacterium]|jgi:DNA processing protein|nr:DNA-processing protein DprA [Acidimicrobiales bacterium]